VSEVFDVDPARPEDAKDAVEAAAAALAAGELVVFPTDTVYGIAARPDVSQTTARLFEAKRRPARLTLPVLVAAPESAWRYGERTDAGAALAAAFWPGPITLVARRTEASAGWNLADERGTIGLRVPDHSIALAILDLAGALATTSANPSGRAPIDDPHELRATFGGAVTVYLFVRGAAPRGTSSTVVDVTGSSPRVLRQGPITPDDLQRVLPGVAL